MAMISLNLTLIKGHSKLDVSLKQPVELLSLLKDLDITAGEVGLVVKNGRWEALNQCIVSDGDHIILFPVLQGG